MYFPHEKVQPKRQRSPPPGACRCAAKLFEHAQPVHSAACSGQLLTPKTRREDVLPARNSGKGTPNTVMFAPPWACRYAAKLFEHAQPALRAACSGQLPLPKRGGKMYFPPRFGDPYVNYPNTLPLIKNCFAIIVFIGVAKMNRLCYNNKED